MSDLDWLENHLKNPRPSMDQRGQAFSVLEKVRGDIRFITEQASGARNQAEEVVNLARALFSPARSCSTCGFEHPDDDVRCLQKEDPKNVRCGSTEKYDGWKPKQTPPRRLKEGDPISDVAWVGKGTVRIGTSEGVIEEYKTSANEPTCEGCGAEADTMTTDGVDLCVKCRTDTSPPNTGGE